MTPTKEKAFHELSQALWTSDINSMSYSEIFELQDKITAHIKNLESFKNLLSAHITKGEYFKGLEAVN